MIIGIKLLILSELMLFFACFRILFNFKLLSSFGFFIIYYYLFNFINCFSYAIPLTNLILLVCSSVPVHNSSIFIKQGILFCINSLSLIILFGLFFIFLQCNEFYYSYFSLSDCLIGSIFYFTTGLHGFHVLIGIHLFFIIFTFLLIIHFNYDSMYLMENHLSLFFTSFY